MLPTRPDADDPEGLVHELVSRESVLFPLSGLHGGRCLGNHPDQGEHHGDRMLPRGDSVAAGGVHDDDSPFAGRRNIHVVETDPGPADDGELVRAIDHFPGNLRGTPDDQSVVILDDRVELVGAQFCPDIDLDARCLLENLGAFRGQVVADQDFLHGFLSSY